MSIVIFFSRLRYNFDGIVDTTTGRIAATKTSAKLTAASFWRAAEDSDAVE